MSEAATRRARVLVAEDEPSVRASLERVMAFDGHEVLTARDGVEVLERLRHRTVDAIVLDVAMPRLDGLEACRRLRAQGVATPVLMLTARAEIGDRVDGLDAGADDYLTKPFALSELRARVRALLRRGDAAGLARPAAARFGDLTVDPTAREARRANRRLELTRTEFDLLVMFVEHARIVLTREQILDRVWGYDPGASSNALGVIVSYLRRKLEAGGEPRLLHTVRGVGYVLREPG